MTTSLTSLGTSDLQSQRDYVKRKLAEGFDFSLMVADAFIRGIRDLGYKSTATALDELIDNSGQAGATKVAVALGFGESTAKPTHIAVIDNGHGMDPEMIRLAVVWGGTHRENDRTGFGRFGYGLPSASVSQARRFTVYSSTGGSTFHSVTLDVDEIAEGRYLVDGRLIVPEAKPARLPQWVQEEVEEHFGTLPQGTVVVLEKLDPERMTWTTASALERNLLEHFGLTYRNFLREMSILVNGKLVDPIDPLFLTPGFRHYDLDDQRAEAYEPLTVDVKDANSGQVIGTVKVRYSYMPPTFLGREGRRGRSNARFAIRSENNGIIVLRQGRQIDVITRPPFTSIQNNDKYWGVEVDFPATLDEEFRVTTSKQQVTLSSRIWDILKQAGVYSAIQTMRTRWERESAELKERIEREGDSKRASEQAMEEAAKFKTALPGGDPEQRRRKAEQNFEREAKRRADESGLPLPDVERQLLLEIEGQPYKVEQESLPGAPFYRAEQRGGQKVLFINTAHRFYTDMYASSQSTRYTRAALEVLLFVLGECELDSNDERQVFYETERSEWSKRLNPALDRLKNNEGLADRDALLEELSDSEAATV